MRQAYPNSRAVVISADGVWHDTGRQHALSPGFDPTNVGAVLLGAAKLFGPEGEGVVMLDVDPAKVDPAATVDRREWLYTEFRPWTTFRQPAGSTVHLGLLGSLDAGRCPLWEQGDDPGLIARRLGEFHKATGAPWHGTAGIAGHGNLRARFTSPILGKQPLWRWTPETRFLRGVGPLVWTRALPDDATGWMITLDINAMYLAALRNVLVAWGELSHTGAVPFDSAWPGFWEISSAHIPRELLDGTDRPPVLPARLLGAGSTWVTTDVMKLLAQMGIHPDIIDSWTSENPHPVFRSFAERLISARTGMLGQISPEVKTGIKRCYTETVGLLGRASGRIHRPDWQMAVIDLARCNLLRRIHRAHELLGVWPHRVHIDAVSYLWPDPNPRRLGEALGTGSAAGTFKFETALTVNEWRAKTLAPVRK